MRPIIKDRHSPPLREWFGTLADIGPNITATLLFLSSVFALFGWRFDWLADPARPVTIVGGLLVLVWLVVGARSVWERLGRRRSSPPPSPLVDSLVAPTGILRGLLPFVEGDRILGRDTEIQAVLTRLAVGEPVVIVCGVSGVGKTSLLRAGLATTLSERGYRPVYVRPTQSLVETLDTALRSATRSRSRDWAHHLAALAGPERRPVVFLLDQVESYREDDPGFTKLGELLCRGASSPGVVLAVRGDRLAGLARVPELFDWSPSQTWPRPIELLPLTRDEARTILDDATTSDRVPLAPDLIRAVVDDLSGMRTELAEAYGPASILPADLQLVATWLKDVKGYTRAYYRAKGRVTGILGSFLQQIIIETGEPQLARTILQACIHPNGGRQLPRPVGTLAKSDHGAISSIAGRICAHLQAARLLQEGPPGHYQLVHDALVPIVERALAPEDPTVRRANDLLLRHVALQTNDPRHTLPLRQLLLVQRAQPHLRTADDTRRLLHRSWWALARNGSFLAFLAVLLTAVVTLDYGYTISAEVPMLATMDYGSGPPITFANRSIALAYVQESRDSAQSEYRILIADWDSPKPELIATWTSESTTGRNCLPTILEFSADDSIMVIGDTCGAIRIADARERRMVATVRSPPGEKLHALAVRDASMNGPVELLALSSRGIGPDETAYIRLWTSPEAPPQDLAIPEDLSVVAEESKVLFAAGGEPQVAIGYLADEHAKDRDAYRLTIWALDRRASPAPPMSPALETQVKRSNQAPGVVWIPGSWLPTRQFFTISHFHIPTGISIDVYRQGKLSPIAVLRLERAG
jgi:hypothetical protein